MATGRGCSSGVAVGAFAGHVRSLFDAGTAAGYASLELPPGQDEMEALSPGEKQPVLPKVGDAGRGIGNFRCALHTNWVYG